MRSVGPGMAASTAMANAKQRHAAREMTLQIDPEIDEQSACGCVHCKMDRQFLRGKLRPAVLSSKPPIRLVDLFAGCGGMSLGIEEAARQCGYRTRVELAMDSDPAIAAIYRRNFPSRMVRSEPVDGLFDGSLGARRTSAERKLAGKLKAVDLLLGGPPCQGHSDLNNHTRRRDPRNLLYLQMARAAEVLEPKVAVIENVPTLQWDHSRVLELTVDALRSKGYRVHGQVIDSRAVGVPQRRRRFVVVASGIDEVDPEKVLREVTLRMEGHPARTVRWAIEDLVNLNSSGDVFDSASRPTDVNAARIDYLFANGCFDLPNDRRPECHQDGTHSYVSVYGRLQWDKPAQTITTGFGCMGQGRYVHPSERRTITPHEAARLQTFPDWFDFGADTRRGGLAKAIGNAVPPLLMRQLGAAILPGLLRQRTVARRGR